MERLLVKVVRGVSDADRDDEGSGVDGRSHLRKRSGQRETLAFEIFEERGKAEHEGT